jgi:ferric-dicitrate binding protein FerR (iron transport regulator)
MDQEKLIRYVEGNLLSESDLIEVLDWIDASDDNRKSYEHLKGLWVLTGISKAEADTSLRFFPVGGAARQSLRMRSLFKYAAIFVLAFFIGASSLYLYNNLARPVLVYNEIKVPEGEKSMVSLYDGTKVWLNSGTTLKYPATFSKKERKVYLDGEGFFDVAENAACPFVVSAHELNIKVLGTRFNVDAYAEKPDVKVTLERGAVYTQASEGGAAVVLAPGEQAIYNRSLKQIKQARVDPCLYSSWKENLLRFENAPLAEVIQKMEHWYGVQITMDRSVNPDDKFTMAIKTESLREMLNLISKTIPVKYEIDGDKVFITRL